MRHRKRAMVRAVDLREKRRAAGYTAETFAEAIEVSDSKYVLSLEAGKRALTLENAGKAAYVLNTALMVEIDGVGPVWVAPAVAGGQPIAATALRPGEAAWIALEEYREAMASLERLQDAVMRKDWDAVSRIYEQTVCDTQHADALLAAALDRLNPAPGRAAHERHARKIAAKLCPTAEVA